MEEDIWEDIDLSEAEEVDQLPQDVDKKIANYQAEAGKNVDIYLTVDDVNVYITDISINGGKLSYNWFTYKKMDDKEKSEFQNKIDEAIKALLKQQEGKQTRWSLRKQFSRICSTIANTLARFFRT